MGKPKILQSIDDINEQLSEITTKSVTRINIKYPPANLAGSTHEDTLRNIIAYYSNLTNINGAKNVKIEVYYPNGVYNFSSTMLVNMRYLQIIGESYEQTLFTFGDFTLFQLGTDDGNYTDYKATGFGGSFTVKNISFRGSYNISTGDYPNSIAIQDFGGGSIVLKDLYIQTCKYGFWGVNSDVNSFTRITGYQCDILINLLRKSDQNTLKELYVYACNTAVYAENISGLRIKDGQFVTNNKADIIISCNSSSPYGGSGLTDGYLAGVWITDCWFENFTGVQKDCFIMCGGGDKIITGIHINNFTTFEGGLVTKGMVIVKNADKILIENPTHGQSAYHQPLLFVQQGNINQNITIRMPNFVYATSSEPIYKVDAITNGTSPRIFLECSADTVQYKSYGGNVPPRLVVIDEATPANSFRFDLNGGYLYINSYDKSTGSVTLVGKYKLNYRVYGTAAPTTGTFVVNDEVINSSPSELGTAGSKYIVDKWKCIWAGSPGSWVECRMYTGN